MPTLAHEGNPKEASITIAVGDVLSTARLDVDFLLFQGAQAGSGKGIPPLSDPLFAASGSCPDVFVWSNKKLAAIPFNYNDPQSSGSITIFTDQLTPFTNLDQWLALTVHSSPDCCGCAYVPVWMVDIPSTNLATDQVFPVHDITVLSTQQSVTGTPYVGVAAYIEDGSTAENFTGIVLASNYETSVTKLMSYTHQSLCQEGKVLALMAGVPTLPGGYLTLGVLTDPNAASVGDTIWEIDCNVKDINGNDLVTALNLKVHDSVMDATYTSTGRGTVFTTEAGLKPRVSYVYYKPDGSPIYSTLLNAFDHIVHTSSPTVAVGHRHNRANVGIVALGNHPVTKGMGGSNLLYVGGSMVFGADANHFGIKATCDSYSFGTGTVA